MGKLVDHLIVVKNVECRFEDLDHPVLGKIYEVKKGAQAKFAWELNCYCRLPHEATVYIPSGPFGDTLEETEMKLMGYIMRFEDAVEIKANPLYT